MGTVVANLTGLPMSGATVSLSPGGLTTTTSGNGTFYFPTVTAGSYTLSVNAGLLYQITNQTISVTAGNTTTTTVRVRTILGL